MKIKRYMPVMQRDVGGNYAVMAAHTDSDFYSRADLIAAGCLVPVKAGEPCEAGFFCTLRESKFLHDGQLLERFGEYHGGPNVHCLDMNGEEIMLSPGDTIQPVRLVPLKEVSP